MRKMFCTILSLFGAIKTSNFIPFSFVKSIDFARKFAVGINSFYLNSPKSVLIHTKTYLTQDSLRLLSLRVQSWDKFQSAGVTAYNVRCKKPDRRGWVGLRVYEWSGRKRVLLTAFSLIARCIASLYSSVESPFPFLWFFPSFVAGSRLGNYCLTRCLCQRKLCVCGVCVSVCARVGRSISRNRRLLL